MAETTITDKLAEALRDKLWSEENGTVGCQKSLTSNRFRCRCKACTTERARAQLAAYDASRESAPPSQTPDDWSVYNSVAEVASGLSFSEALDYLTPERLARGWTAVCVVNKDNAEMVERAATDAQAGTVEGLAEKALRAAAISTREYVLGFCSRHLESWVFDHLRRPAIEAAMVAAVIDSDSVRAALASREAQPAVPKGWKLVPIEPTEAMKRAAVVYANGEEVYQKVAAEVTAIEQDLYGEVYAAMLAAAPSTKEDQ